ncbi:MAG: Stp1/IreP family PP2C-type Ser/Thr phosphatase [Solirubrobacteraceae bacterium]|nr:Stp1/IreP family PP2C-type Ser/Thr phosphatase [Solirubrobacteraceae bacterium]
MLRVAEHVELTDTGRQRRANEDAFFARSPLFAVADGMGGAQAGEVASRTAVDVLAEGLPEGESVEQRLAAAVQRANERIHALSVADEQRAGMGTTLTVAHVGDGVVTIAHVGDSRCYRWSDGRLERLTSDHSLVEELVRQGRLSRREAEEHPQRSIITRALGPEGRVRPDATTVPARGGETLLLCSDGLTSMVTDDEIAGVLAGAPRLADAARALVDRANAAGGRDNITVVLVRLEEVGGERDGLDEAPTRVGDAALHAADVRAALARDEEAPARVASPPPAAPSPERPVAGMTPSPERPAAGGRASRPATAARAPRRRRGRLGLGVLVALGMAVIIGSSAVFAIQAVFFVSPAADGFVTVYRGVPYRLAGVDLYQPVYTSGVSTEQLTPAQRTVVSSNELRSREDADDYVRQLELGSLGR